LSPVAGLYGYLMGTVLRPGSILEPFPEA